MQRTVASVVAHGLVVLAALAPPAPAGDQEHVAEGAVGGDSWAGTWMATGTSTQPGGWEVRVRWGDHAGEHAYTNGGHGNAS